MWQNLCANINYYKICFKCIVLCFFVRHLLENSGSSDLVRDSSQILPFKSNVLHMPFKLGSIKIKVKFNCTVLNTPFLKSAFEISILPNIVFMLCKKGR